MHARIMFCNVYHAGLHASALDLVTNALGLLSLPTLPSVEANASCSVLSTVYSALCALICGPSFLVRCSAISLWILVWNVRI